MYEACLCPSVLGHFVVTSPDHDENSSVWDLIVLILCFRCDKPTGNRSPHTDRLDLLRADRMYEYRHDSIAYEPARRFSVSSTHRLTARLLPQSTHARLHLSSLPLTLLSSSPPSLSSRSSSSVAGPEFDMPIGPRPQSCHRTITPPATPHTSSQSASNSRSHPSGRAIWDRRVARRMEAHARVCGGCKAGAGVRFLFGQSAPLSALAIALIGALSSPGCLDKGWRDDTRGRGRG